MDFSHAYLLINETPEGTVKQARLVYDVSGGQSVRAFPVGKEVPTDAVAAEWDAETLTLTCTLEGGETHAITLTEADIEAAKDGEAL